MQLRIFIWILICFFLSLMATPAVAVEFVVVGPRAAGMGGAGVAVTTDAYATYWNPAGLAMIEIFGYSYSGDDPGDGPAGHRQCDERSQDFNPNDTSSCQSGQSAETSPIEINRPGARSCGRRRRPLYQRSFRRSCVWLQCVRCRTSRRIREHSGNSDNGGGQTNLPVR